MGKTNKLKFNFKKKRHFPKETEAAWFVLKNFIHPLDCSERYMKAVIPMNGNEVLSCILSGREKYSPNYMTKNKLHLHLLRKTIYYFRTKYNAVHTEGYGSSDKQAQNLPFAHDLNITHKLTKYDSQNIILAGIDIDAHNNETDALEVQNWIQSNYFKQSYWEPSSNYSGRHGYIKIAYPTDINLNSVISSLKELFTLLNKKREQSGFQAPVDIPCGLPSTIALTDENPYPDIENDDPPDDDYIPKKYDDNVDVEISTSKSGSISNSINNLSPVSIDIHSQCSFSSFHFNYSHINNP